MTRILTVSLVTLGDPGRLTGGYRYHRRMAELAPACGAAVRFVSFPDRRFPLPALSGPAVLRRARADVLVLDSIAAAFLGPWLPRRPRTPLVGSLHQPPGGSITGRCGGVSRPGGPAGLPPRPPARGGQPGPR